MTRSTSIITYREIIDSGLISKKRMQVLDIFYDKQKPLTGSEVAKIFKTKHPTSQHSETIRNRISELRDQGVLCENGTVPCPFTNRTVIQFALTNKMPVEYQQAETLNQKLDKVLLSLVAIGKKAKTETEKQELRDLYDEIKNIKKPRK